MEHEGEQERQPRLIDAYTDYIDVSFEDWQHFPYRIHIPIHVELLERNPMKRYPLVDVKVTVDEVALLTQLARYAKLREEVTWMAGHYEKEVQE